ncbi:uncharacterized protein MYCGRDRAFT_37333, partial [Zymoseptoria tritici IPO323]
KYPILFQIARDYLAIIPTSAPAERVFSRVGDIVTKKRNRLRPDTIKKLIILKCLGVVPDEESTINDFDYTEDDIDINSTLNKGKEKVIEYLDSSEDENSEST